MTEGEKMFFPKDRALDLICFGRVGVDFNPIEFNFALEDVRNYRLSVGGSPANIAIGSAKLGLKVGFIGKVSSDAMGTFVKKKLRNYHVDTSNISVAENSLTSLAITEVQSPSDCSVVFYRDNVADLKICCDDISEEYIASAKAILISGTALAQSPSREAVYRAVEYAKKNGTVVMFDIDYRDYNWAFKEEAAYCYDLLCSQCDVIFGTREEFNAVEYLIDRGNKDDRRTAKRYLDKGAEIVVIKHGAKGFSTYLKDGRAYGQEAVPTNIRKTFGAGDALAAGFISTMINCGEIELAITNGGVCAAIIISRRDCSEAMPYMEEINNFKKNLKPKIMGPTLIHKINT